MSCLTSEVPVSVKVDEMTRAGSVWVELIRDGAKIGSVRFSAEGLMIFRSENNGGTNFGIEVY